MSTYSTNLALELIGTGERSGTWGTATNTNLGTLVEQAISGYVTQTITDGADTVITIPNGADGVARNMYIECTGNLTANRNLIVPANKKLYFIYNNTSGGNSVVVKVSGQTGIVVPTTRKMALVCNGTDVYVADDYLRTGNLSAAADSKYWDISPSSGGVLEFRAVNDTFLNSINFLSFTRTGIAGVTADYSGGCFRVSGSGAPTTGAGVELVYQAGVGYVTAYDRSAAAYIPLYLRGNGVAIITNGINTAALDSQGVKSLSGLPFYAYNSTNTQSLVMYQGASGGVVSPTAGTLSLGGSTVFFSNSSTAGSATAGAATLPSNPVGFLIIGIGVTQYKIPYYTV